MTIKKENTRNNPTTAGQDEYPAFKALRNIDLNLLTVFEAVYIHKGIVNAAKVLNITPSAISQSIQKLRYIFPDPLFIRKGQGVAPTAYAAHLHEYISKGLESILGALDFHSSGDKQRTITIATPPSIGALVIPRIYQATRRINDKLLIRNIPVNNGELQLTQFQTDLLIDTRRQYSGSILSHTLFKERLIVTCRKGHPCLADNDGNVSTEQLRNLEHTFIILHDDTLREVREAIDKQFPGRTITFSSYNILTVASLIGSSDLIGFIPERLFSTFRDTWNLCEIKYEMLNHNTLETNIYFNNLSTKDSVLQEIIEAIRTEFAE